MSIYKYTRVEESDTYYADPLDNYGETTIEQTAFGKDTDYLCYVEWTADNLPEDFSFVSMTDQEALDWCNANIEHEEWEEFTLVEWRIQDNRVLDDLMG